jgi:hypothetical protein
MSNVFGGKRLALVIGLANAIVQPFAVMIVVDNTLIADKAVPTELVNS